MRLVYKDCRFCKGTGEFLGRKCKVCKGEGQIPVKVSEEKLIAEAFKNSEADKQNEAFSKIFDKIKSKYGDVSETEFMMLREMFDSGVDYGKRK